MTCPHTFVISFQISFFAPTLPSLSAFFFSWPTFLDHPWLFFSCPLHRICFFLFHPSYPVSFALFLLPSLCLIFNLHSLPIFLSLLFIFERSYKYLTGGQPAPWSYRCCGALSNTCTLPSACHSTAHAKKCKRDEDVTLFICISSSGLMIPLLLSPFSHSNSM